MCVLMRAVAARPPDESALPVEPEPAEPEEAHAGQGHRQVMGRTRALAWPEDERTDERGDTGDGVHD